MELKNKKKREKEKKKMRKRQKRTQRRTAIEASMPSPRSGVAASKWGLHVGY